MSFTLTVAWRYLRARRRASVSVIGGIAILGITLGVGVLCAVLAVTSGFQEAFREKVLGVNAHLLVLKYGWDFTEYRDVMTRVRATPGVVGAAPFLINPMMITRGDRIAGVLVKGVDPARLGDVLDLPTYLAQGGIEGMRRPGAEPPAVQGEDQHTRGDRSLGEWLTRTREENARARAREADRARAHAPPARAPSHEDNPEGARGTDAALREAIAETEDRERGESLRGDEAPAPSAIGEVIPSANPPAPGATGPVVPAQPMLPSGPTPTYELPPDDPDDDPAMRLGAAIRAEAEEEARRRASELPGAVLGRTLARTLHVRVGDQVRIISPLTGADAALVRHGSTPRARDFRVVGIFDAGFDEYDARLVYVDLWEAQRFFEQGDAVTGVEVKVLDIERARLIGRRIERELGGAPYHTLDWEALNRNLFTALKLQKVALSIVITIIIVVAAFNVVATLVMVVLDKRREIAILKAMGASEGAIRQIFLLQGAAIGAVGTTLGLLFGGFICFALAKWHYPLDPQVYLIRHVPVRASVGEFVLTGVVSMTISLVAALVPAAWAARLAPVEGLRYE